MQSQGNFYVLWSQICHTLFSDLLSCSLQWHLLSNQCKSSWILSILVQISFAKFATTRIATRIAMIALELSKRSICIKIHIMEQKFFKNQNYRIYYSLLPIHILYSRVLQAHYRAPSPPPTLPPPHKWQKETSQHNCLLMSHIHTPHTTYAECGVGCPRNKQK